MKGLFPDIEVVEPPRRLHRTPRPHGHKAAPGTGPRGETCATCKFVVRVQLASKCVFKCGLMRRHWTGGRATDVLARDPACGFWRTPGTEAETRAEEWAKSLDRSHQFQVRREETTNDAKHTN